MKVSTATLVFFVSIIGCFGYTSNRVKRQGGISFGGGESEDPNSCDTPPRGDIPSKKGTCKSLLQCGVLLDGLRSNPTGEFYSYLRKSICTFEGNTPILCCPPKERSTATICIGGCNSDPSTEAPSTSTEPVKTTANPPTTESTTKSSTTTLSTTTVSTTSSTPSPTTPSATTPDTSATTPTTPIETTTSPSGADTLPTECGVSDTIQIRIVGGEIAKKGALPWIGLLGYRTDDKLDFLCGATLITKRHIITAAHCVIGRSDLEAVRLGEHDLNSDSEAKHQDFGIIKTIMHEDFDTTSYANDIAILVLDRDVDLPVANIMPACMSYTNEWFSNNTLKGYMPVVAGWGALHFNSHSSNELRLVSIPIIGEDECAEMYSRFAQVKIDHTTICAGKGNKDACQGDSGGPLIQYHDGLWYLIGVVSFGYRCAEPNFAGVYTKISSFENWINNHLDFNN